MSSWVVLDMLDMVDMLAMVYTGLVTLSPSTELLARTPGRENSGWLLIPVRTPERFGVGMPGMLLTVVSGLLAAIWRRPRLAPDTVTLAGTGKLSDLGLLTGGSPRELPVSEFLRSPGPGLSTSLLWREFLQ